MIISFTCSCKFIEYFQEPVIRGLDVSIFPDFSARKLAICICTVVFQADILLTKRYEIFSWFQLGVLVDNTPRFDYRPRSHHLGEVPFIKGNATQTRYMNTCFRQTYPVEIPTEFHPKVPVLGNHLDVSCCELRPIYYASKWSALFFLWAYVHKIFNLTDPLVMLHFCSYSQKKETPSLLVKASLRRHSFVNA